MSLNYTFYWILIAAFLCRSNFVNIPLTSLRENTPIYNCAKIHKPFFNCNSPPFPPDEKPNDKWICGEFSSLVQGYSEPHVVAQPHKNSGINIPREFPGRGRGRGGGVGRAACAPLTVPSGREGVNVGGPCLLRLVGLFFLSLTLPPPPS